MFKKILLGLLLTGTCFAQELLMTRRHTPAIGSQGSVTVGLQLQNSNDSGNSNQANYTPFRTPTGSSGYTVSQIQTYISTPQSATNLVNIYTDSSGVPTTKICTDYSFTGTLSSGFNNTTPTGCTTLTADTWYWMAQLVNNNTQGQGRFNTTTCPSLDIKSKFKAIGSTTLGSSVGGGTADTGGCYSQYIVLTCVIDCGTDYASLIDWHGSTNGTVVTPALAAASTVGCRGTIAGNWSGSTSPLTGLTFSTTGHQALVNSKTFCGTSTTGSGTLGIAWATGSTPLQLRYDLSCGTNPCQNGPVSIGYWFEADWDSTGDATNAYSFMRIGASGDQAEAQLFNGVLRFEVQGGTTSNCMAVSANTFYFITMQYNAGGTHHLSMYNSSGTQLCTVDLAATGTNIPLIFELGITGTESEAAAHHIYWGAVAVDSMTGHYPILP